MTEGTIRGVDLGITPGNGTPGSFAAHTHSGYDGPQLTEEPRVPAAAVTAYFAALSRVPKDDDADPYEANQVFSEHLLMTSEATAHLDDDNLHRQAAVLNELAFQSGQPIAQTAVAELDLQPSDISLSDAATLSTRLAHLSQQADQRVKSSRDVVEADAWSNRRHAYALAAVDTAAGFTLAEGRVQQAAHLIGLLGSGRTPEEAVTAL